MMTMKIMVFGLSLLLCFGALAPGMARAETLEIEDMIEIETGSTTEWDGGDYVAINMSKGNAFAWFGVVYGNETHNNSVTIVAAHLRFLGGAEVRSESGGMMIPETGIPVLTVYIQKLAALIEFSDDGYLDPWQNEMIGADNGLFDFDNAGCGLTNFSIGSVEPVHKILDLNRSWDLSDITEVSTVGTTEKEWSFTLSNKNLLYSKIWDNEPGVFDDGSRPGRESDGKVHDVAFSFHIGTRVDEFNVSVPWYRVTYDDGQVIDSEETGTKEFEGKSLTTEFKFDHWIKDWDYQSKDNYLMLETVTAFGTFIPDFVKNWLDVQFVNATSEKAAGIAEIETFTGGQKDILSTDGIPDGAQQLTKDTVVFKDNWQKVGVMSWVSNVTVDDEEKNMSFQIHAGENINWPSDEDNGFVNGIIFLGGYIYPMGHDIFHDPSYVANALFLDIGIGFYNPIGPIIQLGLVATAGLGVCAIAYTGFRRIRTLP